MTSFDRLAEKAQLPTAFAGIVISLLWFCNVIPDGVGRFGLSLWSIAVIALIIL